MDISVRPRVIRMWSLRYKLKDIHERLASEGIVVSKTSLSLLIKKFKQTGSVANKGSLTPSSLRKLREDHLLIIDRCMAGDDELTWRQLHLVFLWKFPDVAVSLSTIQQVRKDLSLICKKTRYCVLISEKTKRKKRLGVNFNSRMGKILMMCYLQMNVLSSWRAIENDHNSRDTPTLLP